MGFVKLPGGLCWPPPIALDNSGTLSFSTNTMNVNGEYAGVVFIPHKNVTVRKIIFKVDSVASFVGTAVARVEQVGTNGQPDGTEVGAGAEFTPAAGWFRVTLAADAPLTAGTPYFIGTKITAYTSGSFVQRTGSSCFFNGFGGLPYTVFGTTPGKDDDPATIGIELADGTKYQGLGFLPVDAVAWQAWRGDSIPDRRGLRFKFPFRCKIIGVWVHGQQARDQNVHLYGSDGVTKLQETFYEDGYHATSGAEWHFYGFNEHTLEANAYYRVVFEPTTTGGPDNVLARASFDQAGDMDCWPGGQDFHWTEVDGDPADESDWTNDQTKRPIGMALVIEQIDVHDPAPFPKHGSPVVLAA